MKIPFSTWYTVIIVSAGLAFAAMALTSYATGNNSLLFIGMGFFMALCMTMTSIHAQRQQKARKAAIK
ncbi:hypothetical protein ACLQ8T_01020 [Glutamicibacter sp. FR1]|uniref:hypothetical protein n=1 Tax=Glutamicibacter sp. FR1 TaxID=3393744 RepID=UPI0039B0342E